MEPGSGEHGLIALGSPAGAVGQPVRAKPARPRQRRRRCRQSRPATARPSGAERSTSRYGPGHRRSSDSRSSGRRAAAAAGRGRRTGAAPSPTTSWRARTGQRSSTRRHPLRAPRSWPHSGPCPRGEINPLADANSVRDCDRATHQRAVHSCSRPSIPRKGAAHPSPCTLPDAYLLAPSVDTRRRSR